MEFQLTDQIKRLGVSRVFASDSNIYIYNGKGFAQSPYYKKELQKTLDKLKDKMLYCGYFGDEKTVQKIIVLLSELWINSAEKEKSKSELKEEYTQVYRAQNILAEAIIIGQKSYYLVNRLGKVQLEETIEISDTKVIKPFEQSSYVNRPYIFKSKEHFNTLLERARSTNLDSLYNKVKLIWRKYIDESDNHLSVCSADSIFSYYQDVLGMTHYLFFIGDNDVGKSNNLHVINFLAYRNMLSTDMTYANIYSYLGSKYEGIGTLCEDEADNIDEDREKMRIYKNGYVTGFKVARTDTNTGEGRKQDTFFTFCFKAFAAEKLPDSFKAKGFNERVLALPCTYGFPKYDISEVVNPAGDNEHEELLQELNDTRNISLISRVLYYNEKIPNITLNISNREKQLFKPVLRMFQGSNAFQQLLPVISNYVSQKRQQRHDTQTAFNYALVSELVKEKNTTTLGRSAIWDKLIELLPGGVLKTKLTYDTEEFGEISHKALTQMLIEQFDAKPRRNEKERQLVFNKDKLNRLGLKYKLAVKVQVVDKMTDMTDMTDVGLDRHLKTSPKETKPREKRPKKAPKNNAPLPVHLSDLSYVSRSEKVKHSTYWIPNAGKWGCKNCKDKGDKFQMMGEDATSCNQRERRLQ